MYGSKQGCMIDSSDDENVEESHYMNLLKDMSLDHKKNLDQISSDTDSE